MPKGTGTFDINGVTTEGKECKARFKDLIRQDLDYIIRFKVDDEMLYGDYINVMASAMEALNDLKEEYALERYLKHWNQISSDEKVKEINEHLPFRFFEESEMVIQK
jgi:hypothetical protein